MTGLEIGAIIAAVAGAAMQQYANYSANKAAQAKLNDAMYQLNDDGKKINDVIAEATKDMDAGKRYEQQQEIAKNVSDDLKSNVAESQALRNESQAVQGNVSNDYAAARQAANEKTMATSNAFADLVGKIRSAAQLRQNEGINLTRAGQKVDQLARDARGNWQVGQVRVNDALHSKDGLKAANTERYLEKQIIATLVGVGFMIIFRLVPYWKWCKIAPIIYVVSLVPVFLVKTGLGVGEINGATRWLNIGGVSVQPSEFVKVGLIYGLAAFLAKYGEKIKMRRYTLIYVVFTAIAVGIVLFVTSNLSAAIILCGISYIMLLVAKPNLKFMYIHTAVGIVLGIILVISIIKFEDFPIDNVRIERIRVWADPSRDPQVIGYQIFHSRYAIGSGGLFGKGLGNGVEKFYLPEPQNDMIFSVICEETGLFGALCLITLFVILIFRLFVIANNVKDILGSLIVVGILSHISLQFVLNIAVATNTIPNTGITLPFISYGLSSLVSSCAAIGLVMNVSLQRRKY